MNEKIENIVSGFTPISLHQMRGIKLMNRSDTKYVTHQNNLEELLRRATESYCIQEIDGIRISNYQTLYYDTPDNNMFLIHHNGKKTREKVRVRTYADTSVSFFEVKKKDNKGRTHKSRIETDSFLSSKEKELVEFIQAHTEYDYEKLTGCIKNDFNRITLVNKLKTERVTIDFNIRFYNFQTHTERELSNVVIIELKRDGDTFSPIVDVLLDMRIHPSNISKYCIGSLLTNQSLKHNMFKKQLMHIDKLTNYSHGFTF
jgi:hypothetical protein